MNKSYMYNNKILYKILGIDDNYVQIYTNIPIISSIFVNPNVKYFIKKKNERIIILDDNIAYNYDIDLKLKQFEFISKLIFYENYMVYKSAGHYKSINKWKNNDEIILCEIGHIDPTDISSESYIEHYIYNHKYIINKIIIENCCNIIMNNKYGHFHESHIHFDFNEIGDYIYTYKLGHIFMLKFLNLNKLVFLFI